MSLKESAMYIVKITLITENGELPTDSQIEEVIGDCLTQELLDEDSGLFCGAVDLIGRLAENDE